MGKQQYHFVSMAEPKKLKKGDIIFVGLRNGTSLTYQKAVVLSPLFWNSDSDEPDYELETTNGFVDINSIYLPKDDDDNEETIEVISRQAVMDTLTQTYFKYESERLDAIQNLPIYTIPKPEENWHIRRILYFVNHPQEIKNIELDNESSTFDILPVPIIIDGYHRWMAARYLYELGSLHKIHCLYAGREDVLDYLKGKLDTMPQEEIA